LEIPQDFCNSSCLAFAFFDLCQACANPDKGHIAISSCWESDHRFKAARLYFSIAGYDLPGANIVPTGMSIRMVAQPFSLTAVGWLSIGIQADRALLGCDERWLDRGSSD
jgi:hypothetical protein